MTGLDETDAVPTIEQVVLGVLNGHCVCAMDCQCNVTARDLAIRIERSWKVVFRSDDANNYDSFDEMQAAVFTKALAAFVGDDACHRIDADTTEGK